MRNILIRMLAILALAAPATVAAQLSCNWIGNFLVFCPVSPVTGLPVPAGSNVFIAGPNICAFFPLGGSTCFPGNSFTPFNPAPPVIGPITPSPVIGSTIPNLVRDLLALTAPQVPIPAVPDDGRRDRISDDVMLMTLLNSPRKWTPHELTYDVLLMRPTILWTTQELTMGVDLRPLLLVNRAFLTTEADLAITFPSTERATEARSGVSGAPAAAQPGTGAPGAPAAVRLHDQDLLSAAILVHSLQIMAQSSYIASGVAPPAQPGAPGTGTAALPQTRFTLGWRSFSIQNAVENGLAVSNPGPTQEGNAPNGVTATVPGDFMDALIEILKSTNPFYLVEQSRTGTTAQKPQATTQPAPAPQADPALQAQQEAAAEILRLLTSNDPEEHKRGTEAYERANPEVKAQTLDLQRIRYWEERDARREAERRAAEWKALYAQPTPQPAPAPTPAPAPQADPALQAQQQAAADIVRELTSGNPGRQEGAMKLLDFASPEIRRAVGADLGRRHLSAMQTILDAAAAATPGLVAPTLR